MNIEQQMAQLRLSGMKNLYQNLTETRQTQNLTFTDGLQMLLTAEQQERQHRRTERLTRNARFRYQASLSEVTCSTARNLDQNTIASLTDCSFIGKGQSIIITGATGCGKSFLASALGQQACNLGYKTGYSSLSKLFNRIKISRMDGSILKTFDSLAKQDLLILDDFGMSGIDQQQAIDLMEIIEDRHAKKATVIASQLPVSTWYDIIPDSTIADAILDRLVHTAIRIELKGDSLRKIK